jgi:hypothetical protein
VCTNDHADEAGGCVESKVNVSSTIYIYTHTHTVTLTIVCPTDWTHHPLSKQPPSILRLKSAARFIPTPTASSARCLHPSPVPPHRPLLPRSRALPLPTDATAWVGEKDGGGGPRWPHSPRGRARQRVAHPRPAQAALGDHATLCSPPAAQRSRSTLTARRSNEKGGDTSSEVEEKGVPSHTCARRARLSEAVMMELGDGGEPNEANQGKMNRAPNPFEWVMLCAHVPFP